MNEGPDFAKYVIRLPVAVKTINKNVRVQLNEYIQLHVYLLKYKK